MLHRLLKFVTAQSLVLCVLTVTLWVRGHFAQDRIRFTTAGGDLWRVQTDRHALTIAAVGPWPVAEAFGYASRPYGADWDDLRLTADFRQRDNVVEWRRLGLSGVYGQVRVAMKPDGTAERPGDIAAGYIRPQVDLWSPAMSLNAVHVPFELMAALTALLPAGWFVRRAVRRARARKDEATGRCRVCGYDLRATPKRCPECGARPTAQPY